MGNDVIHVKPIETAFVKDLSVEADKMLTLTEGVAIKDQPDYENAGSILKEIKATSKILTDKRRAITVPLDNAKKEVMNLFRDPIESLSKAEGIVKKAMITYTDEQERIRLAQEEKLRKQAAAEEARKKKALEDRAKKAEAEGNAEKAEALREKKEEVKVEAPVLAKRTETPKGVSYTDKWTAEVVDKSKLPIQYLEPNMSMLNKMAQATKGKVPIAGVVFKSEKILASRSK